MMVWEKLTRTIFLAAGALIVSACILACDGSDDRKMAYYAKGEALYRSGDWDNARLELKKALQVDERFAKAQYLLGMLELKRGNLPAAYAAFAMAAEIDPADPRTQVRLGKLLLVEGNTAGAQEKVRQVLKAHPRDEEALLLQGALFLASGEPGRAAETIKGMIGGGPGRADAYLLLALAYHLAQSDSNAEKTLKEGIGRNPASPQLHRALADLYARQGQSGRAAAEIAEMIRLEPSNYSYRITLADLLWRTGQQAKARAQLETLLGGHLTNEDVVSAVARFYASHDDLPAAERLLMQRIAVLRKSLRLRVELADLYAGAGRAHKAMLLLEECLALERDLENPEVVAVENALAALHLERGEISKSRRITQEVLKRRPADHDANVTKGKMNLLLGRGAPAVAALRTAVRERPSEVGDYLLLAEAYLLKEDMASALQTLQEAQKLEPSSVAVRVALVRYHQRRNDLATAETEAIEGLSGRPNSPELLSAWGDVRLAASDGKGAEKCYRAAALAPGGSATGRAKLSELYAAQGMPERAVRELAAAVQASPASPELFERLILHYLQEGKIDEAASTCRRRIASRPEEAIPYLLLARIAAAEGDFAGAETSLREAESRGATFLQVSLLRAHLRTLAGDRKGARALLEEALAQEPYSLTAANDYAYFLATSGQGRDLRKALKIAEQVNARRPGDPQFNDTLGWILYLSGDHLRAPNLLQQAAAKLPGSPVVQYHAGMALYRAGKLDAAKVCLRVCAQSKTVFAGKNEALLTLEVIQ